MTENHPVMDRLERAVRDLHPERTTLLLGAGAAYSSGAPLAEELCRYLERELAEGQRISDELTELAGILENRRSRHDLVQAVVRLLAPLKPDGALKVLAKESWRSIYTTNYDRLVEAAYDASGRDLSVVRSHFDWDVAHEPGATRLFKIHGCITQDRSLGHKTSMTITAGDYVEFEKYRKLLFDRFKMEIAGGTAWIVGYSMRDPHIRRLVDDALRLQKDAAAPGRLFLLVYEYDEDRAALWRSLGVNDVIQGDLNAFAHSIAAAQASRGAETAGQSAPTDLPARLMASTIDARQDAQSANARRLFFGGPASFADIRAGLTFERDAERSLPDSLPLATVITGVAGTGKTTLARRILHRLLASSGCLAFEHRSEFPLQVDAWLSFEKALRQANDRGVLLVDNCPPFQRQVNLLVRQLPVDGHLSVVVTAETSAWRPRQKDSRLFSHSKSIHLSELSKPEIRELCHLATNSPPLRALVERSFLRQTPRVQRETLERRCSADMFVCLKTLFSSESLDEIVLKEYAAIDSPFQDVYRTTAALEAAGALPHRQMVLRLTNLPVSLVSSALEVLEGLVDEPEPNHYASPGIFSWRTRHEVVATLIARYKYSSPEELKALLEDVIATANPSYYEEARTLRELCNSEHGVRALPDVDDRIYLYRRIVEALPADRVARHRLVRELISAERLGDAEAELKGAIAEVGLDPPLQRYRVRLHIVRSRGAGLLPEDRRAILERAMTEAEKGMSRFGDSKYMYFATADVAEEWFDVTGERGQMDWARHLLEKAYEDLLDPDLRDRAARLGRR